MHAALVDPSGLIVNVIVLDEGADYVPPEGLTLVLDSTEGAEPGGSWDGTTFSAPPPPPPKPVVVPPTKEQLLAQLAALQAQIVAMQE
jgi:hypothetical protein